MNPIYSFTSADTFPAKLLQDPDIIACIRELKFIPPVHVQLIPTNRCNLSCQFCSCSNEDRSLEMSEADVLKVIYTFHSSFTKAVTITGGGEPLLFPHLNTLLTILHQMGIKFGIVTNGMLLHKAPDSFKYATWCRISQDDDREMIDPGILSEAVARFPNVGWAFSYVASPILQKNKIIATLQKNKIIATIKIAELFKFTHVRVVADLLQPDKINLTELHEELMPWLISINTPVIFQGRQEAEQGKDCRICYLKPVIGPDMKVYACCGVQYALAKPSRSLPPELCLGTVNELPSIIIKESFKPFHGAEKCVRCYYGNYNRILDIMVNSVAHPEFV